MLSVDIRTLEQAMGRVSLPYHEDAETRMPWDARWSRRTPFMTLFHAGLITVAVISIGAIVVIKSRTAGSIAEHPWLMAYTVLVTTFELSRIVGAIFFQHVDKNIVETAQAHTRRDGYAYEPRVSFVIPCKNEEKMIAHTVAQCFLVDYPNEKIEVIVVNDGSTDNTGEILERLRSRFQNLNVVQWSRNRGKRHAMVEGFLRAQGDIIVQLDSDSFIESRSFRNLIIPFRNPEVGAVCAHADPVNPDVNWLTKMQTAYYFMSFRILKAAESAFLTVFCCSGCSSAYRRSAVLPILNTWREEKFLGLPVTWGDDRALTNWVLRRGYHTLYTDRVQAYTACPTRLTQFLKQQIRWKKGWFVNSLFASRFVLKDHPFVALTYFFPLMLITLATPFMVTRALIVGPLLHQASPWYYLASVFLVAVLITVYYRHVARGNKYWPYLFVWSAFNLMVLSFIFFYAMATIQNRKWGTR